MDGIIDASNVLAMRNARRGKKIKMNPHNHKRIRCPSDKNTSDSAISFHWLCTFLASCALVDIVLYGLWSARSKSTAVHKISTIFTKT